MVNIYIYNYLQIPSLNFLPTAGFKAGPSTGCSRKNAQSFTRDKFGTVRRKMKIFAPKCLAEITVY